MIDLRIVFMGTPDFAVTSLKALVEKNYTIVGVITAPDRHAGRGRKLNESAVKKYALEQNLNILQPTNLKNEEFINELNDLKANLQIVVAFRMLPKIVWSMPSLGTFNLHASLLPDYRGAAPINWAIIDGENKTGVTTFFIDEKIDTGEIILQRETLIETKETAGDLHDKLMLLGSELIVETVQLIESGLVKTIKQAESKSTKEKKAPKLFKENCKIDWHLSRKDIYNKIRGLSPYPAAWTLLENNDIQTELKIYSAEKEKEKHDLKIGTVVSTKNELKIAVQKGFIIIKELQLAGKRRMPTHDLLNGYSFTKNAKVM